MAAVILADGVFRQRRERRVFRPRKTLDDMRDADIISRYRLTREGIFRLEELLARNLSSPTNRSRAIPVLTKILIGLRYLAKGDFLSEVADIHGVSRSSACHIIMAFVHAVNETIHNISFPNGRDLEIIKHGFYTKCRIPNTIGAVDGTLVPIIGPIVNEHIYICRKQFHAINVQGCVDDKARFIDIVAKWPGSTHDASIFNNCSLKEHLERNHVGHLLGDSGYALKKYLLTPVLNPDTPSKMAYNEAQSSGRMVVERAFGLLKSRFRCLHRTGGIVFRKPERCCQIIIACAKLHNFCSAENIPMPEEVQVAAMEDIEGENLPQPDVTAVAYRDQIIDIFR